MPNWCDNKIVIQGNALIIKKLYDACLSEEDENLLQELRPMPKNTEDWYQWRQKNWGTKWDINPHGSPDIQDNGDGTYTLCMSFDSAWSPPVTALIYFGKQNPDMYIRLDYNEWGNCYCGSLEVSQGKTEDQCFMYVGLSPETIESLIGDELDSIFGISEMARQWEEERNN